MTTAISPITTPNQIAHHTTAPSLIASDILDHAHKLVTTKAPGYDPTNFWDGMSDEQVTGEQVAHHCEAALALLTRDGWTRQYQDDDSDVDLSSDINTMSPVTILRKLFALARWEFGFSTDKRFTLAGAMGEAVSKGAGDSDTHYVAGHILSTLIRASRGETKNQHWLIHDAWSRKLGRTQDEVMALLAAGAAFARQYGPSTNHALFA